MKLADQLAAAEEKLRNAQAFLKATAQQHAASMARAHELHELAAQATKANREELARTKKLTERRLGLHTKKFKDAVRDWVGLKAGEEHEALIRGQDLLATVTASLVTAHTERDPAVKALEAQHETLREQESRAYSAEYNAKQPVAHAVRAVRAIEGTISEIKDKISKAAKTSRAAPKKGGKPAPASPEDAARFVAIRKKLDALRSTHRLDRNAYYGTNNEVPALPAQAWSKTFTWTPPEEK